MIPIWTIHLKIGVVAITTNDRGVRTAAFGLTEEGARRRLIRKVSRDYA